MGRPRVAFFVHLPFHEPIVRPIRDELGERAQCLLASSRSRVVASIKPHPVIGDWRPRWMACWARLEAATSGVLLVRDMHGDVTPCMLAADLLVSDASSAVFEFLALDRPIVLVTNPRHRADPACDPGNIVWTRRDVGEEIHDAADLPDAVAAALAAPDARGERRRQHARQLFGPFTDGRNHVRIAEKVLEVGRALATPWAPRLGAVPASPGPGTICAPSSGHRACGAWLCSPRSEAMRLRLRARRRGDG